IYRESKFSFSKNYWGASLFFTIVFVLLLQTNNQPSYDELWYSLRTHELLNFSGSFFDNIIYPDNWVVYYPKLFETLIFPLQTFDNYAFSKIFSVFIWMIIFFITLSNLTENIKDEKISNKQYIVTLAILTTPAVSNMAILTKGDIYSFFIFLMATLLLFKAKKEKNIFYLLLSFLLSMLSINARLSAIPFAFMLIGFSIWVGLIIVKEKKPIKLSIVQTFILSATLLLNFLVFYRTYKLTGVPVVQMEDLPLIPQIYNWLNFHYNNEYLQPLPKENPSKLPLLQFLFYSLFTPTGLRISMSWYSNLFFLLFIVAIVDLFCKKKLNKIFEIEFMLPILLIVFLFFISIHYANERYQGGDGNYYIIPVIISSFLLVRKNINKKVVLHISYGYILVHFLLMLVTGPNWDPGFKKLTANAMHNPFSGELNKDIFKERIIREYDLAKLIEKIPDDENIVLAGSGNEKDNFLLGHSYINMRNCRSYIFDDFKYFIKFLKDAEIDFLLVQTFPNSSDYYKYCELLEMDTKVKTYQSNNYRLLDVRNYQYSDVRMNKKDISQKLIVQDPKLIYYTKKKTPRWVKPLQVLYDKYYEQRVALLCKEAACYYKFILEKETNIKINLNLSTYFRSKKFKGRGDVVIKIIHNNQTQIIDKIPINHSDIISKEYILTKLNEGEYRIEIHFTNGTWKNWVSLAIANPQIKVIE
ncbi:MAG: hypothetical protein PF487_14645, partial [Bacteroidales bacterium]|nr:hypothetical protein [Bacteroidales bacterium]